MDLIEMPVGFAMALSRNEDAVNAYAMMTKEQKQAVLTKARTVHSRQEMERIVAGLAKEARI